MLVSFFAVSSVMFSNINALMLSLVAKIIILFKNNNHSKILTEMQIKLDNIGLIVLKIGGSKVCRCSRWSTGSCPRSRCVTSLL
jgi:hypothetical protein